MRLVIISSDADDRIGLVSDRVFVDATEATRELARLFAEGAADASAGFYTVDMDTAVPVIVLQQPAAAAAPAEPDAPLDEVFEPTAEMPEPEPEPLPAAEAQEPEAAVAAEAATEPEADAEATEPEPGTQDSVPEDDVERASDEASEPDVEAEAPGLEPEIEVPETLLADLEADLEAEPQAEAGAQWPWDLPVIAPEGAADADDLSAVVSVLTDSAEESDPDVEIEAELPAMDDLAPALEGLATVLAEDPPEDLAPVVAEDPTEGLDAPGEPDVAVAIAVADPQSVLEMGVQAAASAAAGEEQERVYEPGALNMNEYTCDDCVYVNTCPNQHQKKPGECGSFQWRSV